jgi:dimethylhistidine N-methyltransferase
MESLMTAQTAFRSAPVDTAFLRDVVAGLTARPKHLPPKYFYDDAGARLFEAITALPEYYPTRCELALLDAYAADLARLIAPDAALIEFGSGSTRKVRILIAAAPVIAAYVPVDISTEMLAQEAELLQRDHPRLMVAPVEADFTRAFAPPAAIAGLPRVGFFPGSTIGNFEPQAAAAFLRHAGGMLGTGAVLIIGVDLVKDKALLDAAYDDAAGVTARFNLNLLARINRELGADFDLSGFDHRAFYDGERCRVEMHLVSRRPQRVRVAGRTVDFRAGETIHTENSYKYTLESFVTLARGAGWSPVTVFTEGMFAVHALRWTENG